MNNNDIVQKLWNLCDVLRDDGINYSDYVTELVLLLFIKMEYENTEAGLLEKHKLPEGCRWPDLNSKSGLSLLTIDTWVSHLKNQVETVCRQTL
jgi:type I restriction enzyme M protein